jgi:WD40 repeat protein
MRFDRSGAVSSLLLFVCACTGTTDKPAPSASAPVMAASTKASASASSSVAKPGPPAPELTHDPAAPPPPAKPAIEDEGWVQTVWRLDSKGFVASGGRGLVIHSLAGGQDVVIPKGKGLRYAALSPKGDRVAAIDADGVARVWEASTGKLLAEVSSVGQDAGSVSFSPDGGAIVAVGETLVIWDIEKKAERCRTEASWIYQVVFTEDGQQVLGTSGGHWEKRNAQTCEKLADGWARTGGTFGSTLDLRGRWFAAAEVDGHGVALYEGRSFKPVEALAQSHGCTDHVSLLSFSPDGEILLTSGGTRWFKSFRTSSRKTIAAYDIPKPDEVTGLTPFDDGERLYVRREKRVTLVSAVSKQEVISFDLEEGEGGLQVSPDGKHLLTVGKDKANVRDTLTGKVKSTVELPKT